jgi:uncharacterized membrane protein
MVKKKEVYVTSTSKRSFVKAASWEIISFIITLIAVFIVYGDLKMSLKFTLALTAIKIIFLYFHERIWKKTSWGKIYAKKNSRV